MPETNQPHTLDIREELLNLIEACPSDQADGFWNEAKVEASMRNSFCLQLERGATIFTVTITAGGALTI